MPTTRPRHVITETDAVADALADAARRWPQESQNRQRLLLLLIEEGRRAVRDDDQAAEQRRRDALASTSGVLTGSYDSNYLTELREDWPQ